MKSFIYLFLFFIYPILLIAQEPGDSMLVGDSPDLERLLTQDPTYANFAKPDEVLIVYANNVDSSDIIAEYYQSIRNIPEENKLSLYIPAYKIYQEGTVGLYFGEELRGEGNLAWRYVKDEIADSIELYLNNTYSGGQSLSERIRYIVLCKGIPIKALSLPFTWNSYYRNRVSVSALLCHLNQPDQRNFLQLFNTNYTSQINPLFALDKDRTMDFRFTSNHFVNSGGWYTQYLVSWLNGDNYDDVIELIDRLADPDYSGEKIWILDDNPPNYYHHFTAVRDSLYELGFNYIFDETYEWLSTAEDDVMGYVSHGVHANMPPDYILNVLEFNYSHGATFASWESFNATTFGAFQSTHGQLSDFIHVGGSGGGGHVYEPFTTGAFREEYIFPAFAMGYSMVDAQFHGVYLNAWQNLVVGDPLTTIAWGKQSVTQDLTWDGTNLVTGEITVPLEHSITLEDGAVVNFRHDGFITGDGYVLPVTHNFTLNINDWEKAVFRSADNNHPRIIWGAYPGLPALIEGYKIYRKMESANFELIDQVDGSTFEYLDEDVEIYVPINENPKDAEYYITAIIEDQSGSVESEPSNIIDYWVNKAGKIHIAKNETEITYNLDQNYPNPFNPMTTIKYSLKDDGFVKLKIYSILGSEVASLVDEYKHQGEYSVTFNASNLSSGVYIYKLQSSDYVSSKKMILIK